MSYAKLAEELGQLIDEKQAAYGDAFGKSGSVMRLLYPNGISIEQMDDALAIIRILDKLFRIATKKDAFGETPFKDIAGYGLLGWNRSNEAPKDKAVVFSASPQKCVKCGDERISVNAEGWCYKCFNLAEESSKRLEEALMVKLGDIP